VPFSAENLATWLGAAGGSPDRAESSATAVLVTQLYAQELGRPPDPFGLAAYMKLADGGATVDDLRRSMRESLEHVARQMPARGAASSTFRHLQAVAELDGINVSPETIAECIATYQYALGRPPDTNGFAAFVAARQHSSLLRAVRPIARSREAAQHHAPHGRPSADDVARHARGSVTPILDAVAGDITLEHVVALGKTVAGLHEMVATVARQIERVEELLTLHIATSSSQ
jgi:hypothetical protein